jgi:hypothetical protein
MKKAETDFFNHGLHGTAWMGGALVHARNYGNGEESK